MEIRGRVETNENDCLNGSNLFDPIKDLKIDWKLHLNKVMNGRYS